MLERRFKFENVDADLSQRMKDAFHKTLKKNLDKFNETLGYDEKITTLDK